MIEQILRAAVKAQASDVHLNAGSPPLFRVNTVVGAGEFPALTAEQTLEMAQLLLGSERWSRLEAQRDIDFSYAIDGAGRFRINAHFQRNTVALSIRIIRSQIIPLQRLGLPEIVARLTLLPRGLVLVTGPTGCGKSTTLAGMIDAINHQLAGHIVTLEDPIEFVFQGDKCAIEQREVGTDVSSFASGLRHVLRQDPDVILVGEMRDLETTSAAITAGETGHLVLSTLHTLNAPQTIERIIDIYPTGQQNQIRSMLANTLQAVISQTLLRRADGGGMLPAAEIMICTTAARNCIRENRIFELPNIIETSRAQGMQTLDSSIKQLYQSGMISRDDAISQAACPEKLQRSLVA